MSSNQSSMIRRSLIVAVMAVGLLAGAALHGSVLYSADEPVSLFQAPAAADGQAIVDVRPPKYSKRYRTVRLNPTALALLAGGMKADGRPVVKLDLFADASYTGVMSKSEAIGAATSYKVDLQGIAQGYALISVSGDALSGMVLVPGVGQFDISLAGSGIFLISEVDQRKIPEDAKPLMPEVLPQPDVAQPKPARDMTIVGPTVVDMMVVYTPSALAAVGGSAGNLAPMNTVIANAIADVNTAYTNSQINTAGHPISMRLVHSEMVSYTEYAYSASDVNSGLGGDLVRLKGTSDGYMDGVHALRDTYRADLVMLIANSTPGDPAAGVGYVLDSMTPDPTHGFAVVDWFAAVNNHSFAHETGHNFGNAHARGDDGQNPLTVDSYGAHTYAYCYRFTGSTQGKLRTVNAYDDPNSPGYVRIPWYANPSVTYDGVATGVAQGNSLAADNAHNMILTAAVLAGYRNALPTVNVTAPANGVNMTAPATIAITADASDPDGSITKVEFFSNGAKVGEDASAPYSFTMTSVGLGTYAITAVATDSNGETTTSDPHTVNVNNSPPTVTLTSAPAIAVLAPANFVVTANASDAEGTVASLGIYFGTALLASSTPNTTPATLSYNFNGLPAGTYTLTAKATDDVGAPATSTPLTLTVNGLRIISESNLFTTGLQQLTYQVLAPYQGPAATASYTLEPPTPSNATIDGNGLLIFTPVLGDLGTHVRVKIKASRTISVADDAGVDRQEVLIRVINTLGTPDPTPPKNTN